MRESVRLLHATDCPMNVSVPGVCPRLRQTSAAQSNGQDSIFLTGLMPHDAEGVTSQHADVGANSQPAVRTEGHRARQLAQSSSLRLR